MFVTHLSANLSLKRGWSFKKKNANESLKVKLAFSAIKIVVQMHFKDEKEAAQQKVTLFFKFYSPKVKPTSRYNATAHLQYDVTGLELTAWLETLSWLRVTISD